MLPANPCRLRVRPMLLLVAVLLPLAAILSGCSGGSGRPAPDEALAGSVATDLSGSASDPARFKDAFVEGAAPKESERAEYRKYIYSVKGRSVSGDTVTLNIVITDPEKGSVVAEKEWMAVKVGDKWKLKGAPLR